MNGTTSIYLAASDAATQKAAIALGVTGLLAGRVGQVGLFRPVVETGRPDPLADTVIARFRLSHHATGVSYEAVHADQDAALAEIVSRYRALAATCDAVVIVGTDYSDVGAPTEFAFNATLAAHLGAPVLLVVNGRDRTPEQITDAVEIAARELAHEHATLLTTVVTRVDPGRLAEIAKPPVAALPEDPRLATPTVGELMAACEGELLFGDPAELGREVDSIAIGAMSLPNILDRLHDQAAIIVPADRAAALLPALLAAHLAPTFPALSAIVLTGGFPLPDPVRRLVTGMGASLPVLATAEDTFETAKHLATLDGRFTPEASRKIETALGLFTEHVDGDALLARLHVTRATAVTPLMFEYDLLEGARADRRHIVLPEGGEERILRAADTLLRRGVADLTLLGDADEIAAKAALLGVDVAGAAVLSPFDPELRERFAAEYARIRAHKGVSVALARDTVTDVSYFGTLMVHLGLADGMVSGAAHTTTHTIRPAFEIIKTAPGAAIVSSVFFMCLEDRVLVYGDCAVNPDPTAEQLADIALQSAVTAERFGVQPRVAMLSYSTGTSGSGVDVDKVRAATALVRERRPDLPVEGPIQYDAAVEPSVARTKMPGSAVAGRATVFVVPDLNTGNNLYKAVQRSAGAIAVGPVLQGLRRPVNDLSRGALVEDIVNTVAITAIQAQSAG